MSIRLDDESGEKLRRLAERSHATEAELATMLLSTALDEADPDARDISELLDGIPGAFERGNQGLEQGRQGLGTPLDEL